MSTVIVSNTAHRRAVSIGGRTLAGRYAGGNPSCKMPVPEFITEPVQGRVALGQLSVGPFSDPLHAQAWALGGLSALLACIEDSPHSTTSIALAVLSGTTSVPAEALQVDTVSPEVVPLPAEDVEDVIEPVVEDVIEPVVEDVIEPVVEDVPGEVTVPPEAPLTAHPRLFTEEELQALPWSGDNSIRDLAARLGVEVDGRLKVDYVAAILASQEPA